MAYNIWHQNGTCELVPALEACAETNEMEGCKFVSLGDCKGDVPWSVSRRNWTSGPPCLTWQRHFAYDGSGSCPSGTRKSPCGWACVSLIPSNGVYLPGWCAKNLPYHVIVEEQTQKCPGLGYILKVAPECNTDWQSYTVGNPIPPEAIQVSTTMDGTPLYLVAKSSAKAYLGYLQPSAQDAIIMGRGNEKLVFTNVKILVYI